MSLTSLKPTFKEAGRSSHTKAWVKLLTHKFIEEPWLERFIDERWQVQGCKAAPLILPDNCMDLVYTSERCWVVGPATEAFYATLAAPSVFGVRFKPGILPLLLGCGAHELKDQRVEVELLPYRLDAAQGRARLELASKDGRLLLLKGLERASLGARDVKALARELGWSERQLQRKLIPLLGYPAKQWLKINRLRRLREQLERPAQRERATLSQVAQELGFYDQAHMNRECKQLTGLSPLELQAQLRSV